MCFEGPDWHARATPAPRPRHARATCQSPQGWANFLSGGGGGPGHSFFEGPRRGGSIRAPHKQRKRRPEKGGVHKRKMSGQGPLHFRYIPISKQPRATVRGPLISRATHFPGSQKGGVHKGTKKNEWPPPRQEVLPALELQKYNIL